ncbi:hypothetical protein CEUSTIGMA_g3289.t1 [Chlamydomonas eustigma]|uniref:Uncharacterized protein n=1 Tax=Chlamydomonas eustigma TaxID=1157962 RepID=A0A250WYI7_9CHLO|nr:hypothetical protein CEUSTIGMA_g3289.t1 [Chlamydomonas eustigma]|eukprot:GAX75846.1 hypothetical protein CEUSTIGMA_g3289.t1 [Chlamydomonas eustigma]
MVAVPSSSLQLNISHHILPLAGGDPVSDHLGSTSGSSENSSRKGLFPLFGSIRDDDSSSTVLSAGSSTTSNSSSTAASKLIVGPAAAVQAVQNGGLVASAVAAASLGPYWVVAVGNAPPNNSTSSLYEWVVVSGGLPIYQGSKGCSTFKPLIPTTTQYKGGLWILTRSPVDLTSTSSALKRVHDLGLDSSLLLPVAQKGCRYEGSYT